MRTHPQNNQSKVDWRCSSSSRAPALQVQRPELKLQYCQKNNKKANLSTAVRVLAPKFHFLASHSRILPAPLNSRTQSSQLSHYHKQQPMDLTCLLFCTSLNFMNQRYHSLPDICKGASPLCPTQLAQPHSQLSLRATFAHPEA
jgi:hypothetical protein